MTASQTSLSWAGCEWFQPAWLTKALWKSGCIQQARVIGVAQETIGAEVGFLDSLTRVMLTYDAAEDGAPRSVVIKVSSTEAIYQRIGDGYDAYEREFHFYESIAPEAPIRLPRCYVRHFDAATGAHVLVLEDLGQLKPGDQVAGLTPHQALAAVASLGRLQAAWWNSPALEGFAWMPRRNLCPARYEKAWPAFRSSYASLLGLAAVELGDRLQEELPGLLQVLDEAPWTIVHSDFRADNLLFDDDSQPNPVVIVDWQLAIRGRGVFDVARLLCGSLSPGHREVCEIAAVQRWHESLVDGGVRDYSFDRALADYRMCVLVCLYYPVTIHAAEEAAGVRGSALAHAQIERFFSAAVEWYGEVDSEEPPRAAG